MTKQEEIELAKNYKAKQGNIVLETLRFIFLMVMLPWLIAIFVGTIGIEVSDFGWSVILFLTTWLSFNLAFVVPYVHKFSKGTGISTKRVYWLALIENIGLHFKGAFLSFMIVVLVNMYSSW